MDLKEVAGLEGKVLGTLVLELQKIDQDYRKSEELIRAEEHKNKTLVGMLRDQITQTEEKLEGKQL